MTRTASCDTEEGAGETLKTDPGVDWRRRSGPVASLRGRRLYKLWMDEGVLRPDLNRRCCVYLCKSECRRACVRSEDLRVVQMHV